MNLSKNLIVALMGLGCYAHCNNINLANNTTTLLIILALLAKWRSNENTETENENQTTTRSTTVTFQDGNGNSTSNTRSQTVYGVPTFQNVFPFPCYGNFPSSTTTWQTSVPFNSGMMTNGNWGCPCCANGTTNVVF